MTRCINCTRCVRFGEEIGGIVELGQLNRGEDAEIGTFIEAAVTTELSGNLIDVCPVGALTSKPYAFNARPWELRKTETIDVHDGLGCNIRVDSRGPEVMRILPRLHEEINEEWINDRSRFSYDGLKYRRLDRPYIRDSETKKMRECSWEEALTVAADKLQTFGGEKTAAFAGDLAESESIMALKDLMESIGSKNIECRVDGARFDPSVKAGYLFNSGIAGIDEADAILLVGTNPRWEGTMVNARIRKNWLEKRIPVGVIGPAVDLTYPYQHLGAGPADVDSLKTGKDGFAKKLKAAKKPMMVVGAGAFLREDGAAVQAALMEAAEKLGFIKGDWNGFNVMQTAANRAGALELGFYTQEAFDLESMALVYLLNVDDPHIINEIHQDTFVIYQGHHGDAGAARADLILPGAAYTEKDGLYMNTEGRVQMARKAADTLGEAKEDWKIIRALSGYMPHILQYNDLYELRQRLCSEFPAFLAVDQKPQATWKKVSSKDKMTKEAFESPVKDFYQTNVITRASKTMAECSRAFLKPEAEFAEAAE